LVRGEFAMGPLLYNANAIFRNRRNGAPIKIFFPPEGRAGHSLCKR